MSNGFARPITIKNAIDHIVDRTYLLPAIQRKFVWSSDQIEVLFDSIMRGYPINSFMFWEIKEDKIKNDFKFYQFLTEYRQFFKEDNPDIDTKGYKPFFAVIDGQQRLTSIYIGLKGSYAYKLHRKWLYDTEENMPTRHLYLNISSPLPEENERQMVYDFQFLTKAEYERKSTPENVWFKINDILRFEKADDLDNFIEEKGWLSKQFTKSTIRQLRKVIFDDPLINYYLETTQEIDTVLDIFIRTNSGGEPLSFSDLLMSITTAHWKADARKEIPDVVSKVFAIGNPGFLVNKDFVLKTCLVLFNDNIKFELRNFDQSNVILFEQNWDRIKKSITETFTLLSNLGFNNHSLRAKNAAIPIIYYIYHRGIENDINSPIKFLEDKQLIRKWLCLSLLKGVFGNQSDTVLAGIRKVIKAELADTGKSPVFPLDRIKSEFKGNPSKNLSFEDEFIEGLLTTQKDASECFPILSLIYSHLNFGNQDYHKDHLHPASSFYNSKRTSYSNDEDFQFYTNPTNWNSILNLQLLNGTLNQSKLTTPLGEWVTTNNIDRINQLIPDVSLNLADFRDFVDARRQLLIAQLKRMV
ncbi:DUF262 domain-containing protein [Pedobacter sp. ASV12]|uniref:DUF262 domain-containing protein n=1 Tax=Pedobacter sp. ASV12 TaxID=2795120 RepID=UPI0018ECE0C1|nr:DUF262 domain-containing protein [Pedobacter sp. ASV12]